jgi:hypothetical protein
MGVWYTTREDVKSALDSKETARNNVQIDRAIETASRTVESLLNRRFYPEVATRYFDWPNERQYSRAYRLWLDEHELVSVTSLVSGGVTIGASDYYLEPINDPPYDRIEMNLGTTAAFSTGNTHQRNIVVTGVFAGCPLVTTPAGTCIEVLDSSETGVDVSDGSIIGVGDIIKIDSERMIVTEKSMLSTGVAFTGPASASAADDTIPVADGTVFNIGEVIRLDTERMLVVDIAVNNLVVKRAWDGTRLDTHTSGTIYAPRTLTVQRGALGTTAASHLISAPITKHVVPGGVKSLTVAYALNEVLQQGAGYARVSGSGDNQKEFTGRGIKALEDNVKGTYGRKARKMAV